MPQQRNHERVHLPSSKEILTNSNKWPFNSPSISYRPSPRVQSEPQQSSPMIFLPTSHRNITTTASYICPSPIINGAQDKLPRAATGPCLAFIYHHVHKCLRKRRSPMLHIPNSHCNVPTTASCIRPTPIVNRALDKLARAAAGYHHTTINAS